MYNLNYYNLLFAETLHSMRELIISQSFPSVCSIQLYRIHLSPFPHSLLSPFGSLLPRTLCDTASPFPSENIFLRFIRNDLRCNEARPFIIEYILRSLSFQFFWISTRVFSIALSLRFFSPASSLCTFWFDFFLAQSLLPISFYPVPAVRSFLFLLSTFPETSDETNWSELGDFAEFHLQFSKFFLRILRLRFVWGFTISSVSVYVWQWFNCVRRVILPSHLRFVFYTRYERRLRLRWIENFP